jgi:Aminoglycoside-2''-adenylyltransferase
MRLATLEAVFRALDRANVRYLIAGGVAVNAHGFNRATHDIDLVVQLDPSNVISAMQALTGLGFRPALPVSAEEFADSTRRRRWIEERNMQVFSLVSDDYRDAAVDIFASRSISTPV